MQWPGISSSVITNMIAGRRQDRTTASAASTSNDGAIGISGHTIEGGDHMAITTDSILGTLSTKGMSLDQDSGVNDSFGHSSVRMYNNDCILGVLSTQDTDGVLSTQDTDGVLSTQDADADLIDIAIDAPDFDRNDTPLGRNNDDHDKQHSDRVPTSPKQHDIETRDSADRQDDAQNIRIEKRENAFVSVSGQVDSANQLPPIVPADENHHADILMDAIPLPPYPTEWPWKSLIRPTMRKRVYSDTVVVAMNDEPDRHHPRTRAVSADGVRYNPEAVMVNTKGVEGQDQNTATASKPVASERGSIALEKEGAHVDKGDNHPNGIYSCIYIVKQYWEKARRCIYRDNLPK